MTGGQEQSWPLFFLEGLAGVGLRFLLVSQTDSYGKAENRIAGSPGRRAHGPSRHRSRDAFVLRFRPEIKPLVSRPQSLFLLMKTALVLVTGD